MKRYRFSQGQIIEVLGNVASGKTTFSRWISRVSNAVYLDIDVFARNPFLAWNAQDPVRWSFTTALQFSLERSRQISVLQRLLARGPVVLDSGFDMGIYVYSKHRYMNGEMTKEEWELLCGIHRALHQDAPRISTTIVLDASIHELRDRIRKRGRMHETAYTDAFVQSLHDRLDEYMQPLGKHKWRRGIVVIRQDSRTVDMFGKPIVQCVELAQSYAATFC